jgi:hypothetical protein
MFLIQLCYPLLSYSSQLLERRHSKETSLEGQSNATLAHLGTMMGYQETINESIVNMCITGDLFGLTVFNIRCASFALFQWRVGPILTRLWYWWHFWG